jgi:type II secretion system protein N
MTLSPRVRAIARIAGFILLGVVTFVYALHYTFPYERVQDRVVELLASKYEVKIGGVERSKVVPGRFALTSVTLRSRPSVAGQPVTTMFFKRIEVDVSFLPLIAGKAEVGIDVSTGNGGMTGTIKVSKVNLDVDLTLKKFPLSTLPGIADAVGLPLGGAGDGHVRLTLPKGDWSKASGNIRLSCTVGCTVGDGVSRVYPKAKREADQLMVKDGIPVETINVKRFVLGLRIAKGEARNELFEFESPDGEIELAVSIKLAKKWDDSVITGCIRYKCEPEYNRRAPAACDLASPLVDNDGFHNIKLSGKLATMKRTAAVCDAGGDDGDPPDAFSGGTIDRGRRERPTIEPEPTGGTAIDAGFPPVQMGKPMPMADDVNPRIDAAVPGVGVGTASGTGNGAGTATPGTGTGTTPDATFTPPPPPPVPGSEGGIEQPSNPDGTNGANGGASGGTTGGTTAPNGTYEQPPIK